jgi:hypothetical protein
MFLKGRIGRIGRLWPDSLKGAPISTFQSVLATHPVFPGKLRIISE